LQIIAVDGLRRYGFRQEADRLARTFVSLVVEHFDAQGTIVEKYDIRRRSSALLERDWLRVDRCRRSGAHGGTRSLRTVEGAGRSGPLKGRGR
jgi:trehalase-like protein